VYDLTFEEIWSGDLDFYFGAEEEQQDSRITDLSLNIGNNVLDIYYDYCYVLVCTTSGVECLNSRTFDSVWYFDSTIVKSVCSNQDKVCFGTISSGIYYSDFPRTVGDAGDNFLASCKKVTELTSSGISDICSVVTTTNSGFFSGGEKGVDIFMYDEVNDLKVSCQLTCSGVNSVAYSVDTETYYWSTVNKAYCADTCVQV
jgi:hypothetical protein